jgi:hypothetical protein
MLSSDIVKILTRHTEIIAQLTEWNKNQNKLIIELSMEIKKLREETQDDHSPQV